MPLGPLLVAVGQRDPELDGLLVEEERLRAPERLPGPLVVQRADLALEELVELLRRLPDRE
jgi:hypothetical protein